MNELSEESCENGTALTGEYYQLEESIRVWYNNQTVPMYASGTDNAAPGLALVGEEGPELVYFNGGEKVMDAAKTAAFQSNATPAVSAMLSATGGSSPSVQVVFQISGNATPETVQALQEYGDEFAARVLEVLEDAGADAQRRAY